MQSWLAENWFRVALLLLLVWVVGFMQLYLTQDARRVKQVYENNQALIAGGEKDEAQRIVDSLSESDWQIYQQLKAAK